MNIVRRYFHNLYAALAIPWQMSRQHAELLKLLIKRDLLQRSSGTLLGKFWPVMQTLMQVVGFWFLFDIVYGMRLQRGPSFLEYLLSGILPWFLLSEIVMRASGMFREYASLYRRSQFPIEILPVVTLLVPGTIFILVYPLVTGLLFGPWALIWGAFIIVLLMIWLLPFVYLLAVMGVFLRDVSQTLPILLMFMMYGSPILYFPDMLPASVAQWLFLNPIADLMQSVHSLLFLNPLAPVPNWPNWEPVARLWGLWLLLLAPAWLVYRRALPHVRELV